VARLVELGGPGDWVRARALAGFATGARRAPVARTAAEEWVVLYSEDDAPVGAASRWCPHRGADLLDHAAYDSCPGALRCRHAGYSWWIESGAIRSRGGPEPAAAIELHPIQLRGDGSAYIDLEEPVRR
jgi:nitrite reductase/ring-hydroxylating ferredoxin subunit